MRTDRQLLEATLFFLTDTPIDFSAGVCMCGNDLKAGVGCDNHAPVDAGQFAAEKLRKKIEEHFAEAPYDQHLEEFVRSYVVARAKKNKEAHRDNQT